MRAFPRLSVPVCLLVAGILALSPGAMAACGDGTVNAGEECDDGSQNGGANSCCTTSCTFSGESPDVIVGDLHELSRYGSTGGITGYSVGTVSCNLGSCWLNWISNNAEHPVIGQTMFRLKDGRFEQIGQSWLKHGFTALHEQRVLQLVHAVPPSGGSSRGQLLRSLQRRA